MSYVLGAILLFLLFRFVTGFVIPVYKTVSQVKKQVKSMRGFSAEEDSAEKNNKNAYRQTGNPTEQPKFDIGGEYIPFEEVKDR